VLAVTGPHATQEVMDAVHLNLPKPHDPFVDLVPNAFGIAGIKLTPRHYAYLKISEGCNHRCTFCIIPSMRGDLVSRPIGDVLNEARALFEGGVKELLVISQDTSAYGVDVKYRTGFWDGKPVKTRMLDLVQALGEIAEPYGAWVRLHYVYPYPSVDEVLPLMATGKVLPYLDVPLQHSHPDVLAHEAAGQRREKPRAHCALARDLPRDRDPQHLHRRFPRRDRSGVRAPAGLHARSQNRPRGLLCLQRGGRRHGQRHPRHAADGSARRAARPFHGGGRGGVQPEAAAAHRRDHAGAGGFGAGLGRKGGVGRSYADAPEIDGVVKLLPPEKISKTLKVGEFTRARIVGTQGHDLIAEPV
jgi:ribosomal protein S12 methylthiotransferase